MTEHSLNEFKRQLDDARSRLSKARLDVFAAEKRYQDAKTRKTGLFNKIIRTQKQSILVQNVEFLSDEPWCATGFRIKKDGTAGYAPGRVYLKAEKYEVLPYNVEAAA